MGATSTTHKVPMQLLTLLLTQSYDEEGGCMKDEDSDKRDNEDSGK